MAALVVDHFLAAVNDVLIYVGQVLRKLPLEQLSEVSDTFFLIFGLHLDVFALFTLQIQNLFAHLENVGESVVPLVFEPVNLFLPALDVAPAAWRVLARIAQQCDGLAHRREHLRGGVLPAVHLSDAAHHLLQQLFVVGIVIRVLDDSVSNLFREFVDVFLLHLYVFLEEIGPLGCPGLDVFQESVTQGTGLHSQPLNVVIALFVHNPVLVTVKLVDFFFEVNDSWHVDSDSLQNGILKKQFISSLVFSIDFLAGFLLLFFGLERLVVQEIFEGIVHLLRPQVAEFGLSVFELFALHLGLCHVVADLGQLLFDLEVFADFGQLVARQALGRVDSRNQGAHLEEVADPRVHQVAQSALVRHEVEFGFEADLLLLDVCSDLEERNVVSLFVHVWVDNLA